MNLLWLSLFSLAQATPGSVDEPVLNAMLVELNRSFDYLQDQETPPYWMEIAITENSSHGIKFTDGALMSNKGSRERMVDVDVRVGDWTLDNTHQMIDGGWFSDEPTHFNDDVPLGDDPLLLRKYIWKVVDQGYRTSVRRLIKLESN